PPFSIIIFLCRHFAATMWQKKHKATRFGGLKSLISKCCPGSDSNRHVLLRRILKPSQAAVNQ
ncbi:hypothetical protein, partial [Aeromonas caviae]|uniref:hypothetical protein n=1 Tax=Aeromonas caviae TaxID=648 RepID=UPI0029D75D44